MPSSISFSSRISLTTTRNIANIMLSSSITQGFRRLSVSQVSKGAAALHRPTAATSASLPSLNAVITDQQQQQQQQVRYRSNRSRRGLYNGKDIRSGNNVSFSMKKTKRTFKPNVFKKRVYSETLDEMVRFHLTTSALRSIDKAGGLDNYLLTSKHVTEGEGLVVKQRILKKMAKDAKKKEKAEEMAAAGEEEGKKSISASEGA